MYGGSEKSRGVAVIVGISLSLGCLLGLLGQKYGLDVREDTSLSDGDSSKQLVQLFVVTDGQLEVTGDDPGLLVVTGCVTSQLEDLSCQILHHCSHVHWGSSSNALSIVSLAEQTVDTSNRELESSTAGSRLGLSLHLTSFTASGHDDVVVVYCVSILASSSLSPSFVLFAQFEETTQRSLSIPKEE